MAGSDVKSLSQPLVSIVTPVYNGESYLRECIESVLCQTYQNWDYVIVDNASTDGSLRIAREYAARDPRIRVHVNARTLPAIQNHNVTLGQISSTSKYCKVVFADDWIYPECLERMVALAEANPSVGLVSAYCLEGDHVICAGLPYTSSVFAGRDICRRHLLDRLYLFGSANTVLYRADLVRRYEPFYNERNIHADTEVCFRLLRDSDFGFVHQILTYTRVRPGSLTAASTDISTDYASMLSILVAYGGDSLTVEERDSRVTRQLADYYRFLGRSLVRGRDAAFWAYHRGKLTESSFGFSRARVAWALVASLGRILLSPRVFFEKAFGRRPEGRRPVGEASLS
jgi:glycosyltransferase involved in cell wall biosynthesis